MKLSIKLPKPPLELNPNSTRKNRFAVAKSRKECREAASWLTQYNIKNYLPIDSDFKPKTYSYVYYYAVKKPDDDNIVSSMKSYKDGACDALKIDDNDLDLCRVFRIKNKELKGFCEIVFDDRAIDERFID